jgi:hypothetical protein
MNPTAAANKKRSTIAKQAHFYAKEAARESSWSYTDAPYRVRLKAGFKQACAEANRNAVRAASAPAYLLKKEYDFCQIGTPIFYPSGGVSMTVTEKLSWLNAKNALVRALAIYSLGDYAGADYYSVSEEERAALIVEDARLSAAKLAEQDAFQATLKSEAYLRAQYVVNVAKKRGGRFASVDYTLRVNNQDYTFTASTSEYGLSVFYNNALLIENKWSPFGKEPIAATADELFAYELACKFCGYTTQAPYYEHEHLYEY